MQRIKKRGGYWVKILLIVMLSMTSTLAYFSDEKVVTAESPELPESKVIIKKMVEAYNKKTRTLNFPPMNPNWRADQTTVMSHPLIVTLSDNRREVLGVFTAGLANPSAQLDVRLMSGSNVLGQYKPLLSNLLRYPGYDQFSTEFWEATLDMSLSNSYNWQIQDAFIDYEPGVKYHYNLTAEVAGQSPFYADGESFLIHEAKQGETIASIAEYYHVRAETILKDNLFDWDPYLLGGTQLFIRNPEIAKATGITLNKTTTALKVGDSEKLTATITPSNANNKKVRWSSSNSNVATVEGAGLITAVGKGTVTITATLDQDPTKKVTCTITVTGNEERRFNGIPGGYAPTGNYSQDFTDMTVPSVLGDIPFSRTYNSFESATDSIVGKGFHFNYSMRIIDGPTAYVVMPDSSWWRFTKSEEEVYIEEDDETYTAVAYTAVDNRGKLEWDAENSFTPYTLTTLDQMRYGFSFKGYLVYVEDFKGNRINVTTDSAGKITSMSDLSGLSISFTYSGNLLTQIKDNVSSRTVQYTYETVSNDSYLKTVIDSGDNETTYDYDNGLLAKVTEGELVKAVMTYESAVANAGLIKTITYNEKETSTYDYSAKSSRQVKITDSSADTVINYNAASAITKTTVYPKGKTTISALTENKVNAFHEVTSTKDVLGNVTTYTYDARGYNTSITYPDGSSEQFTYDDVGNKRTHTDKMGVTTTYGYDRFSNLIAENRLLNGVNLVINQYEYHMNSTYPIKGLLKKETSTLGNTINFTEYTYSFTPNNVVAKTVTTTKRVNSVNKSTVIEYDKAGRVTKETTPTGIQTVHVYNPTTELLIRTEVWDNNEQRQTTAYEYSEQGEVTRETDTFYDGSPSGITKHEYDKKTGELFKTIAPDGTITEYTYDVQKSTDTEVEKASDGTPLMTSTTEYDELGREIEETTEDNTNVVPTETTTTVYSYDIGKKVNITTVIDELGGVTVTETGWDGRVLKQTNPSGLVQINTYNEAGQVTREEHQDANGKVLKWTEYTYDDWGRVSKQTNAFDSVDASGYAETLSTYDIAGNVLTSLVKTEKDKYVKIENVYDAWGQKIRSTEYEGFFTATGTAIGSSIPRYTQILYDWDGQVLAEATGLTSILSASTLQNVYNSTSVSGYFITKNKYNNFRQLTLKTDALGKDESYEYDHAGRTKKTIDRNGVAHEVKYDAAGRKTEEKSTDGNSVVNKTYQYDSAGNLSKQTEGATVIEYEYDGTGNVIKETSGDVVKTFSEAKTADEGRSTESIITDKGVQKQKVKKLYNSKGQLTAVYDNETLRASYTYDILDQLIKTTYGNGTSEESKYNPAGLVMSVINKKGTDIISQNDYTYHYNGNQRTKTDSSGVTTYTYDGRGQLVKSSSAKIVQDYTHDSNGNRLTMKSDRVTTAYTYDKNDRLLTEKEGTLETVTYSYDDNGNMLGKTGGVEQTFDLLNRMISYKSGADVTTTYTYHPNDMRQSKKVGNAMPTTHVWLGDDIALDVTGDNTVSYIHGEKLITSTYGWYLYNAHGDVTTLTDVNGDVTRNYEYDAFGNQQTLSANGADNNPYRYSGEYYDIESGYTYLRARYYDPSIGRFVSEDPAFDGDNWYIYCGNDPVNYIDPSGCIFKYVKSGSKYTVSGTFEKYPKWSTSTWSGKTSYANCYAYALNIYGNTKNHKLQPGDLSGKHWNSYSGAIGQKLITAFRADLKKMSQDLKYKTNQYLQSWDQNYAGPVNGAGYDVALVYGYGTKGDFDYHWYRKDSNGKWSHKRGLTAITNVDASGKTITNPKTCNRDYRKSGGVNYNTFVGIYRIYRNSVW